MASKGFGSLDLGLAVLTAGSGGGTGQVFAQDAEPADVTDGNIWLDTSVDPPSISVSNGTAYVTPQVKIVGTNVPMEAMV